MEANKDMEVANVAIQRLVEEEKAEKKIDGDLFGVEDDDDEDQILLEKLLSQVETSKGDGKISRIPSELVPKTKEAICDIIAESTTEEIVKELKEVRRQNTITHWLLSIMIVLTVTWQLSEVSIILKVKDGVSHPFQALGSTLTGMFKKRTKNGKDNLKVPELPKIDIKGLSLDAIES